MNYNWPGNVSELRNAMERGAVLSANYVKLKAGTMLLEGLPHQGKPLVAALGPDSDGGVLVLQLTGNLLDETGIMGEDVVVILMKRKK